MSLVPFSNSSHPMFNWGPSSNPTLASSSLTGLTKEIADGNAYGNSPAWDAFYSTMGAPDWNLDAKHNEVDTQIRLLTTDPNIVATKELQSRFNMTDTLRATKDMIETIGEPAKKLALIQKEIELISRDLAIDWSKQYASFLALGDTPIVASNRADQEVLPKLQSHMKKLKLRYPYSFRAEGALNELLLRSEQIMQNGRFIRPKVISNLPAIGQ